MEFRIKDVQLQADTEGSLKVGGYINVTERESEMLFNKRTGKWFKEVMKKGVFKRAIERAKEIPLLYEHNWGKQLAITTDGSLTLKEDNIGLRFDAVINDESVYDQVRAGLINSCSFGFRALQEEIEGVNSKFEKRFVSAIELMEVSLVKNPAYVGSLCESRSYEEELQEEERKAPEVSDDDSLKEEDKVEDKAEENEADEVTEEKDTEEKSEDKDEAKEETKEEDSDKEDRFIEGEVQVVQEPVEATEVNETKVDKDYIANLVDELVKAKLEEIKLAESKEQQINNDLEVTKSIHQEIEADLEETSMMQNAEVIKLRLQLLKLKEVKEGI